MVHCFESHGYNFAIDIYSGSVHLLDRPAYELVLNLSKSVPEGVKPTEADLEKALTQVSDENKEFETHNLEESLEEISDLINQDLLFSLDTFANLSLDLSEKKTYVKALCLNVAHTCNLDCDYCFASQGKYHGKRSLMSWEVAKQAIDFLIENSSYHKNLDIDFFGGEPLLNFDIVKKTVEYADSIQDKYGKNFRYTFTTNGMALNEEIGNYLNDHMHNVVLSLDGRKEVNDRFRHTIDGKGSYDRIVPKFKSFVDKRGDLEYYIRGTYTGHNPDFYNDIIHMANLGFSRLSMEPVIGDPKEEYMLSEKDLDMLEKQYDLLTDEMIRRNRTYNKKIAEGGTFEDLPYEDRPFIFYHFMMNLEGGPCIYKRISGCGSGSEYMAVTPNGDLYPCHQFVGEENYAIGNVFEGIKNNSIIDEFKHCNCYSREECRSCWAKLYCSGGCAANAVHAVGNLKGTVPFSCQLFRKRMECALTIKADQAMAEQIQED